MLRFALIAAFAFAALPVAGFDIEAMTDDERAAFRAEIRTYLLENPEVLLQAINTLEDREAEMAALADARAIETHKSALFEDGHSWIDGNPEGDITVVEFLDYRCSFCRRAHPVMGELLEKDGNIRLVVKEFPILGPESVAATRFALAVKAAHGDEAYGDVHDALMTARGGMNEATFSRIAEAAGLDPEPILAGMETPEISRIIELNRALAQELGVNGTPAFVVGERMVRGFLPLENMEEAIAEARGG
ncbi:MAG: DsbA family protein [Pseudomonadota bacterium]